MDSLYQATQLSTDVGLESSDVLKRTSANDDQLFLMYFITGTYFGPDLKGERPLKSVFQRMAEGLPPYSSEQLTGSQLKSVEVERIYFRVLRKAKEAVSVDLPLLLQFFQGKLEIPSQAPRAIYPQFPSLFPSMLHPHSRSNTGYKVIENIVFINNPELSYSKLEDVERFKRLTGLESFFLDQDAATNYSSPAGASLYNVPVHEIETNGGLHSKKTPRKTKKRRKGDTAENSNAFQDVHVSTPMSSVAQEGTQMSLSLPSSHAEAGARPLGGAAMIYLPSHPNANEWQKIVAATRSGFALTGSATMGQMGPAIGLMNIGESDDSYFFRVALPGVKRDGKEFSCEVDTDGKVLITGVTTTGEKRVFRHSQWFEMQTQNLCPPGNFSISFQLPGPVDTQHFSGDFGTDGILLGIVLKEQQHYQ